MYEVQGSMLDTHFTLLGHNDAYKIYYEVLILLDAGLSSSMSQVRRIVQALVSSMVVASLLTIPWGD
jgi:hypothetical protein